MAQVLPVVFNAEYKGPSPIWGAIIGSVVAFIAQFALFNICTCAMYDAFYRRHPGWTNVHHIVWEAAWIALSVSFVAVRVVKLTVVAALQIGRIDVPFLAEGVGDIGGLRLDRFPDIFRQAILAHEAHNHPYIERLSKIYLLKIHHSNNFANDAGTAWRLIFVLTLLPWLRQYRVTAKDVTDGERRAERTSHKLDCSVFYDCFD